MRLVFLFSIILLTLSCQKSDSQDQSSEEELSPPGEQLWLDRGHAPKPPMAKLLFKDFNVLPANGEAFVGDVLVDQGRIREVGPDIEVSDAQVVDGSGKYLTPGLIDTHSHMGVYPLPSASAHNDGNEMTSPQTAAVWAEHSFWPQDPSLWRALAGGVTSIQVLPGSANLFGGRTAVMRTVAKVGMQEMKFRGAPQGLKMACGENPKGVYGDKGGPATRMGNYAGYRKEFQKAWEYREKLKRYELALKAWKNGEGSDKKPERPDQQHDMDTLMKVLDGEILVHIHCYRADEMLGMIDLAKTFGFQIRSFHHALEAYKIAPVLAQENISVSTWADWWGFKMEAFDGIPYNLAITHAQGAKAIVHSDSPEDVRFLNVEAAKAQAAGRSIGIDISDAEAIQWITSHPAWALGIEDEVGAIATGLRADLVVWDAPPLSSYAKAQQVYIEGELHYDRSAKQRPKSDFERGMRRSDLATLGQERPAVPAFTKPGKPLPSVPESQQFVIRNARLLDQDGGEMQAHVAVKDGKIDAVFEDALERYNGVDWPELDADGRLLTPGFIEPQTTLGLVVVGKESAGQDHRSGAALTPGFQVLDAIDPFSLHIPINREHGITSAVVKPTGGIVAGLGTVLNLGETADSVEGQHQFLFARVADGDHNRGHFWLHLREIIEDALSLKASGGVQARPLSEDLSLPPIHLRPLLAVLSGSIPLVLEMHRLSDINAAVRFKQDMQEKGHRIRLIVNGGAESWLAADRLAAAQVPVIIAPTKQLPYGLDRIRVRDDLAAFLDSRGVSVILTSDGLNIRRLRQQAGRAVNYGLAYHKALASITSETAQVLGLQDRGRIAAGLRADLVLWDGDPLDSQGEPVAIWIEGQTQALQHRQKTLGLSYKKKHDEH